MSPLSMQLDQSDGTSSCYLKTEAVGKGFYHSPGWNKDYPVLQILTIEDLLAGKQIDMPQTSITFKQAEKIESSSENQGALEFE